METFRKLFESLLVFVYHCFDRIVIQGYLPLLTRPGHIVRFFRDVQGIYPITKQVLTKRTAEYQQWVEAFARNHRIPIQWPDEDMKRKGSKKEDYVRPYCLSMERRKRFGVYFIFKSLEQGPTFRSLSPKFPIDDPDYRILKRCWSRYTHYYFYIRDEVLGPMAMEQKRANSASPSRPHPSARFAGMDAQERRSWVVNPYNSSRGKLAVI